MKFNFLHGTAGNQSSKRLFTLILIILWVIYFFANLFWQKVLKQSLEDNLFYLICVFFTGVTAEKWIHNINSPKNNQSLPADETKP